MSRPTTGWSFRYEIDRSWTLPSESAELIAEILGVQGRKRTALLARVRRVAQHYRAELANEDQRPKPKATAAPFRKIARLTRNLLREIDLLPTEGFRAVRRSLGEDTPFLELVPSKLQSFADAALKAGESRAASLACDIRSALFDLDGSASLHLETNFTERGWDATLDESLREVPARHRRRRESLFFLERLRVAVETFDGRGRPPEIAVEILVWELLGVWRRGRGSYPRRNFDFATNQDCGPFYDFVTTVIRAARPRQPIPLRRIRSVLDSVRPPRRNSTRKRQS